MLIFGLIVSLVFVVICFIFGVYVLCMNCVLFFGVIMGVCICVLVMDIISDIVCSNILVFGYVGIYVIVNVLLILVGLLIVIVWLGILG